MIGQVLEKAGFFAVEMVWHRRLRRVCAGIACLVWPCLCTHGAGNDDRALSKAEYVEIARQAASRMNRYLEEHKFLSRVVLPDMPVIKYETDECYKVPVAIIDFPVQVTILARSGRIIGFINVSPYGRGAPVFPEKPKPTFSDQKVVSLAQEFVETILGEMPKGLKLHFVHHYYAVKPTNGYYPGTWRVAWNRVDARGHEFAHDGLNVELTERDGPYILGVHLCSQVDENYFEPISQAAAIVKANEFSKQMFDWPPLKDDLRKFTLLDKPTAKLEIVNPNHIPRLLSLDELAQAGDQKARLAWVVTYTAAYTGEQGEGGVPAPMSIGVWVDAETGEFLGGKFK
jgi:hypothetical protein